MSKFMRVVVIGFGVVIIGLLIANLLATLHTGKKVDELAGDTGDIQWTLSQRIEYQLSQIEYLLSHKE